MSRYKVIEVRVRHPIENYYSGALVFDTELNIEVDHRTIHYPSGKQRGAMRILFWEKDENGESSIREGVHFYEGDQLPSLDDEYRQHIDHCMMIDDVITQALENSNDVVEVGQMINNKLNSES